MIGSLVWKTTTKLEPKRAKFSHHFFLFVTPTTVAQLVFLFGKIATTKKNCAILFFFWRFRRWHTFFCFFSCVDWFKANAKWIAKEFLSILFFPTRNSFFFEKFAHKIQTKMSASRRLQKVSIFYIEFSEVKFTKNGTHFPQEKLVFVCARKLAWTQWNLVRSNFSSFFFGFG